MPAFGLEMSEGLNQSQNKPNKSVLHAQIKSENVYNLLKHKLRTPQIFFEHTVFSLKFPAYIAVHKPAITNSTKHVTHPTSAEEDGSSKKRRFICRGREILTALRGNSARTLAISNGNRTSCRPIRSVIIRVITKSDDRPAGVWTTRNPITN